MTKTVAKKANNAVVSGVPDYLAEYQGEGTEDVSDLVVIPRIKLLQGLSPEVMDDGQRAGEFYHTVAEQPMGLELIMVPIYVGQSVTLWRPRKDGGGILARAMDGVHWDKPDMGFEVKLDSGKTVKWFTNKTVQRSGLCEFGTMDPDDRDSYPAATRVINIIAMFPDHPDLSPAAISLQRSSFKVGQQFISKLRISKLPSWSRKFVMTARKDRNADNEAYFNWSFQVATTKGDNGPEPMLIGADEVEAYRSTYEHFKTQDFVASGDEVGSDDEAANEAAY